MNRWLFLNHIEEGAMYCVVVAETLDEAREAMRLAGFSHPRSLDDLVPGALSYEDYRRAMNHPGLGPYAARGTVAVLTGLTL